MNWLLQKVFEAICEYFQNEDFPVEIYFENKTVTFTHNRNRYSLTLEKLD
jgi:hypothetical protein